MFDSVRLSAEFREITADVSCAVGAVSSTSPQCRSRYLYTSQTVHRRAIHKRHLCCTAVPVCCTAVRGSASLCTLQCSLCVCNVHGSAAQHRYASFLSRQEKNAPIDVCACPDEGRVNPSLSFSSVLRGVPGFRVGLNRLRAGERDPPTFPRQTTERCVRVLGAGSWVKWASKEQMKQSWVICDTATSYAQIEALLFQEPNLNDASRPTVLIEFVYELGKWYLHWPTPDGFAHGIWPSIEDRRKLTEVCPFACT